MIVKRTVATAYGLGRFAVIACLRCRVVEEDRGLCDKVLSVVDWVDVEARGVD